VERVVSKQELPQIERDHRLICTKLQAGRTLVHGHADARPGPEFEPVEADLEDVYFSVMAGHHGARAEQERRDLVPAAVSVTPAASSSGARAGALGEVFRFEVEYRLRQPSTWIYALVLFGMPFLLMHAINGSSRYLNAPVLVMQASALLGGLGMLVTAGSLRRRRVARRADAHALAVLHVASPRGPLPRRTLPRRLLGERGPRDGRPAGAAPRVGDAVHAGGEVRARAARRLRPGVRAGPAAERRRHRPFMFAAAALTRQTLATYLGGVALFLLGTVAGDVGAALGGDTLQTLLDPFGGGAIAQTTQYWTPAEQNARLIGWPAVLLANRALWLGVAALAFALLVARFRFTHPGRRRAPPLVAPRRRRYRPRPAGADPGGAVTRRAALVRLGARARQTVAVAARAWREVAATKAFLLILAGAMVFVFATGWDVGGGIFGDSTWPSRT
jgi:hypothetical protein